MPDDTPIPTPIPQPIMVPLETVRDICNLLLMEPFATLMDIMAEFDLSDEEALMALATAQIIIRDYLQEEHSAN